MIGPLKIVLLSLSAHPLLDPSLLYLHSTQGNMLAPAPQARMAPPASLLKQNIGLLMVVNLRGYEGCALVAGFPGN